jgi:hypothetical protein
MLLSVIVKFRGIVVFCFGLMYESKGCMWKFHCTASLWNDMLYPVVSDLQCVNVSRSTNLETFAMYYVNIKE